MARLQGVLADMSKEDASYHMQRCIDAGLWVPDAKAAGIQWNLRIMDTLGDEHLVHYSEVVHSSEVEMYGQYIGRGRTVCPLYIGGLSTL